MIRLSRLGTIAASLLALALFAVPAPIAQAAEVPSHPLLHEISKFILGPGSPPPTETFEGPCGLALDSVGDLYVSNYYHDQVDVLESSGGYVTRQLKEEPVDGPCALAVTPAGELYLNNYHRNVLEYTPFEFPLQGHTPPKPPYPPGAAIDSEHSTGLALDPASGNLYVDDRTYVAVYEAPLHSGEEPVAKIGEGTLHDGYGVAVSDFAATKGDLYVPDASDNTVKVYDPAQSLSEPIEVIDGAGTAQEGFHSLVDAAVAIDQANGHLYVVDNLQSFDFEHPEAVLDEFNAAGDFRGPIGRWITHPEPGVNLEHHLVDSEPSGLVIDDSGGENQGDVYVTNGNSEGASIDVFGPTGPASTLEVTESGTGGGAVKSQPVGIDCGSACRAEFNQGAEVILTAMPDAGSVFSGWSGACSGGGACRVVMSAARSVSANFEAVPQSLQPLAPAAPRIGGAAPGALSAAAVSRGPTASPKKIASPNHRRRAKHGRHRHFKQNRWR